MDAIAGAPVAVELLTAETHRARDFYRPLLRWDVVDGPGDSAICMRDGGPAATMRGGAARPAAWRVTFAGGEAGEVADRVVDCGGVVLEVIDDMVVATDRMGAGFAVACNGPRDPLQAGPGRASWFEIMTSDPMATDAFYAELFGWEAVATGGADASAGFALFHGAGRPLAGRLALPPDLAPALGDQWMTYFAVPDVDTVAAHATDLGGTVVVPPRNAPTGRVSAVADPDGAVFTLIAFRTP